MQNKKNKGYVRIIGESNDICDLEIRYILSKCMTDSFNCLVCSAGDKGSGKTTFLYGDKYGDNFTDNCKNQSNGNKLSFVEKLTTNLFIESNIIKNHLIKKKKIFLCKFSCSFLMVRTDQYQDNNSEDVYDAFQGLYNPLNHTHNENHNIIEFLQIDIQEPVQLFNLITIARMLQFEKNCEENEKLDTLLIISIESILLNDELFNSKIVKRTSSQIFILDCIGNEKEAISSHFYSTNKEEISKELLITFLKKFIISKLKKSLFIGSIVAKAILDKNFFTIISSSCNNLNIAIDKVNSNINNTSNIDTLELCDMINEMLDNNSINFLVEKLCGYVSFLKKMCREFGDEYIVDSLKNGDQELTQVFEELSIIIYNLSGNIFDFYEIAGHINNFCVLLNSVKYEQDFKGKQKIPINFTDIYNQVSSWIEKANQNYEENNIIENHSSNNSTNREMSTENTHKCNDTENFTSVIEQVVQYNKKLNPVTGDNSDNNGTHHLKSEISGYLTERKGEPAQILLETTGLCNTIKNFGRSKSCSNIFMNYNLPSKVSVTSFSKILLAVNTARRRVREYRKKQNQTVKNVDLDEEEHKMNEYIRSKTLWRALCKSPSISLENIDLKDQIFINSMIKNDPCYEIEKKETNDVEVQVDVIIPIQKEKSKLSQVRCVQINENGVSMSHNSSICASKSNKEATNGIQSAIFLKEIKQANKREFLANPSTSNRNIKYSMVNFGTNSNQYTTCNMNNLIFSGGRVGYHFIPRYYNYFNWNALPNFTKK